eukprot:2772085-Amphidinium_carterae.1
MCGSKTVLRCSLSLLEGMQAACLSKLETRRLIADRKLGNSLRRPCDSCVPFWPRLLRLPARLQGSVCVPLRLRPWLLLPPGAAHLELLCLAAEAGACLSAG